MQRQDWPAIAGIAMFALLTAGSAIFIVAAGEVPVPVIAGALLLLATGQAFALFVQWLRNTGLDERLSEHDRRLRSLSETGTSTNERVAGMQQQITQSIGSALTDIIEEVRALSDNMRTLAKDVENSRELDSEARAEAIKPAGIQARERLDLLLEPVIELSNGGTAHYRARVNMVSDLGGEIPHGEVMRKANAGGVRATLDVHIARLALPVLRRLRIKHPAMCLLLPLGAATLRKEDDVTRLMQVLEEDAESARGIVFDISHGDLGSLDTAGIEGLAKLGRLGAKMALSRVSIAGLDLASLRQLGVRFLDIAAPSLNARLETAPAWLEFSQFARAMQFQMIGGGIENADQAEVASHIVRFGYGPYFAPPRRVRSDAGHAAKAGRTQAA